MHTIRILLACELITGVSTKSGANVLSERIEFVDVCVSALLTQFRLDIGIFGSYSAFIQGKPQQWIHLEPKVIHDHKLSEHAREGLDAPDLQLGERHKLASDEVVDGSVPGFAPHDV